MGDKNPSSEFAIVEGELKETKSRNNATTPGGLCATSASSLAREHDLSIGGRWIFASPHYHGKTPYTYQILFRRHIRPVIERVSKSRAAKQAPIGWHTLRRSLATLLISNGENVKVAQSQLRHTTPKITWNLRTSGFSRSAKSPQEGHPNGTSGEILRRIESAKLAPTA